MKKATFYIRVRPGADGKPAFLAVHGYIAEYKIGSSSMQIGYDRREDGWHTTHIASGLMIGYGRRTRKEAELYAVSQVPHIPGRLSAYAKDIALMDAWRTIQGVAI